MRNLQEQGKKASCYQKIVLTFHCLNESQIFCKFLAFILEFQKFFLDH